MVLYSPAAMVTGATEIVNVFAVQTLYDNCQLAVAIHLCTSENTAADN